LSCSLFGGTFFYTPNQSTPSQETGVIFTMAFSSAPTLLGRQFKAMQTDKDIPGISCGLLDNNVFEWEVMLMISDDCRYYGGMLHFSKSSSRMNEADDTFCNEYRWLLPRPPQFSERIPSHATKNEIRDPNIPPKQYCFSLSITFHIYAC